LSTKGIDNSLIVVYNILTVVKIDNRVDKMQNRQRDAGLTDEKFASLLGIHRTTWAKVKAGTRKPGLKLLSAFDQAFPHERIFDHEPTDSPQMPRDGSGGFFTKFLRVITFGHYSSESKAALESKSERSV
jgi:DNA-binding XRE family transcriptional regulator